jgi:hypothetical protein
LTDLCRDLLQPGRHPSSRYTAVHCRQVRRHLVAPTRASISLWEVGVAMRGQAPLAHGQARAGPGGPSPPPRPCTARWTCGSGWGRRRRRCTGGAERCRDRDCPDGASLKLVVLVPILALSLLAAPHAAEAQQSGKVPRIGFLATAPSPGAGRPAFCAGCASWAAIAYLPKQLPLEWPKDDPQHPRVASTQSGSNGRPWPSG